MDTVVEDFRFFVEGSHVPPVEDVVGLLGMEATHLADGVEGSPSIYNPPFYRESSLLLLELPNITAKCC